ncbi:MAG TPA: hypothetical protein VE967_17815 [Gemmatimonadaceae bacterium]|nr:hypothetical protein [Gemmatimonadaceae bacterium]
MIGTPPPNRDRFLAAIAERIAPDRVQALFLFAPMRNGPVESAVAVLAIDPPPVAVPAPDDAVEIEGSEAPDPSGPPALQPASPAVARPIVLTARYRHTLKGADRGKWELEILEQADAPLITVETVVRGVQQRLDDAGEPERLGADDLRAALADGVWTAPQR